MQIHLIGSELRRHGLPIGSRGAQRAGAARRVPCFDLVDDRRHALMVLGVAERLCLQHAPLFRYYLPPRPAQERQGHHHEHQDRSAKPSSEPKLPRKVLWAGASAIVSQVRGRFAPRQRPHGQLPAAAFTLDRVAALLPAPIAINSTTTNTRPRPLERSSSMVSSKV